MFGRINALLNHFNFSRSHLIDIHEKKTGPGKQVWIIEVRLYLGD